MKNKKAVQIMILCLIACIFMYIIEVHIRPQYFIKSIYKLFLFGVLPIIYSRLTQKGKVSFKINKILVTLIFSIAVYSLIITAYFCISSFIDLNTIRESLSETLNVTKENFIIVALYISFINSFLEEYFFRNFSYHSLRSDISSWKASIFSAALFSIYHISIITSWFSVPVFLMILSALFIVGIFFNYIVRKTDSYINTWIIHLFANLSINTIGLIMFGII